MNKCTHHWIIETNFLNDKPRLRAYCRICKEERTYPKSLDYDSMQKPSWRINQSQQDKQNT